MSLKQNLESIYILEEICNNFYFHLMPTLAKDRTTCSALDKYINSRCPVTAGWQEALLRHHALISPNVQICIGASALVCNLCFPLSINKANICCVLIYQCSSICNCVSPNLRLKFMEILCCAYFKKNLVVYSIYGAKLGKIYKLVHKCNETVYTPQPLSPGSLHPSCLRLQVVSQVEED